MLVRYESPSLVSTIAPAVTEVRSAVLHIAEDFSTGSSGDKTSFFNLKYLAIFLFFAQIIVCTRVKIHFFVCYYFTLLMIELFY